MKEPRYLVYIAGLFVAVLLISNTVSTKLVRLGPFEFDGGTILFPLAYILGDVLTEIYGYKRTRRVIWLGFACIVLMAASYMLIGLLPPAPSYLFQEQYLSVLGMVPRIVLASLAAYLLGSLSNSYIMDAMKRRTKGRWLWTRTIGSTIVGEGIDTVVFIWLAFYGIYPMPVLAAVAASNYIFKVGFEILMTPLTYFAVSKLRAFENAPKII